jgi:enoyl-CoA hydratase
MMLEERCRVLVLTLNPPHAKNAMSLQLSEDRADAYELLCRRKDLRLAVVTGAGDSFCAGTGLNGFALGKVLIVPVRGFPGPVHRPPRKPLTADMEHPCTDNITIPREQATADFHDGISAQGRRQQ